MNTSQRPPRWQGVLWGTLPFGFSILALLVIWLPEKRLRGFRDDDLPLSTEQTIDGEVIS
jgi:hypothetical protein